MPEKLEFWIIGKDKFSKVGAVVGRSLRGLRTAGIAAGAALAGATTAMVAITHSTATAGDEFQKLGIRTGVGAEQLSAWSHAAELADKHSEKSKDHGLKMRALDNYEKAGYDTASLSKHAKSDND